MCPTKVQHRDSPDHQQITWVEQVINTGSLNHVDLATGTNGWASPPGDLFNLRSKTYFSKKLKSPSGDWLMNPAGVDWLWSGGRLDNVLGREDNRVMKGMKGSERKAFVFAVNLQVPGRENCHSAVFYFVTEEVIPVGSLLYRFINGDDAFRNQRFKLVNKIVKGPWIVRAAVGNHAACLLGKALTCRYYKGDGYFEIDVDIGSSAIASAICNMALKYVTAVSIDMGFLVEGQTEEELPERLIGAVRIAHMEMGSATFVESTTSGTGSVGSVPRCRGLSKVNHAKLEREQEEEIEGQG